MKAITILKKSEVVGATYDELMFSKGKKGRYGQELFEMAPVTEKMSKWSVPVLRAFVRTFYSTDAEGPDQSVHQLVQIFDALELELNDHSDKPTLIRDFHDISWSPLNDMEEFMKEVNKAGVDLSKPLLKRKQVKPSPAAKKKVARKK